MPTKSRGVRVLCCVVCGEIGGTLERYAKMLGRTMYAHPTCKLKAQTEASSVAKTAQSEEATRGEAAAGAAAGELASVSTLPDTDALDTGPYHGVPTVQEES